MYTMNTRFSKNKIFVLLKVLLIICITIQLHCSLDACKPDSAFKLDQFDIQEEEVTDGRTVLDPPLERQTWPDEDYDTLYFNSLKGLSYVYLPGYQLANGISESDYPLGLQNNIETPDKMNSIAKPAELKTHNQKSPNDVTQNCFQQCNSLQDNKAIIDFSKLGYKTEPIFRKPYMQDDVFICFTFDNKRAYFPCTYLVNVPDDKKALFHSIRNVWNNFLMLSDGGQKELDWLFCNLRSLVTEEENLIFTPEQISERLKFALMRVVLLEYYNGYEVELLNMFLSTLQLDNMRMSVFECWDPAIKDFIKKLIMNKVRRRLNKESKNIEAASQNRPLKDSSACDITTKNESNRAALQHTGNSNSNGTRNPSKQPTSTGMECKIASDELIAMRNIKKISEYFESQPTN